MIVVSPAVPAELDSISSLYEVLFRDMAAIQPDFCLPARQDEDFILSIMAGPDSDVLSARENGKIVGFALVRVEKTPPYSCFVPHRYAALLDLVVSPNCRGKGVGSRLLTEVKAWAKARALDYVELNVLAGNDRARRLYEKEGFCSRMETMYAKI